MALDEVAVVGDGRVLAGIAVVAVTAAGSLVRAWPHGLWDGSGSGSAVRPGPRLRAVAPTGAAPWGTHPYLSIFDSPFRDVDGEEMGFDQILTAFVDRRDDERVLLLANWPTKPRIPRARGYAKNFPWVTAEVSPQRIEFKRRSQTWAGKLVEARRIGKSEWREIDESWRGDATGWFYSHCKVVCEHVLDSERVGPDVPWSKLRSDRDDARSRL